MHPSHSRSRSCTTAAASTATTAAAPPPTRVQAPSRSLIADATPMYARIATLLPRRLPLGAGRHRRPPAGSMRRMRQCCAAPPLGTCTASPVPRTQTCGQRRESAQRGACVGLASTRQQLSHGPGHPPHRLHGRLAAVSSLVTGHSRHPAPLASFSSLLRSLLSTAQRRMHAPSVLHMRMHIYREEPTPVCECARVQQCSLPLCCGPACLVCSAQRRTPGPGD